jgi:hypothetical protein
MSFRSSLSSLLEFQREHLAPGWNTLVSAPKEISSCSLPRSMSDRGPCFLVLLGQARVASGSYIHSYAVACKPRSLVAIPISSLALILLAICWKVRNRSRGPLAAVLCLPEYFSPHSVS